MTQITKRNNQKFVQFTFSDATKADKKRKLRLKI